MTTFDEKQTLFELGNEMNTDISISIDRVAIRREGDWVKLEGGTVSIKLYPEIDLRAVEEMLHALRRMFDVNHDD